MSNTFTRLLAVGIILASLVNIIQAYSIDDLRERIVTLEQKK